MAISFPTDLTTTNSYCKISFYQYYRPDPGKPAPRNRSTATIVLPLPTQHIDSNEADVSQSTLGLVGNLASLYDPNSSQPAADAINIMKERMANLETSGSAAGNMARFMALAPGINDTAVGDFFQRELGVVRNPHVTNMFNGMRLKGHALQWDLSPTSERDAAALDTIIRTIKVNMHPTLAVSGFALDYPSIATVTYITAGNNNNLPNVRPAFVSGFTVTSGAGNTLSLFKDGKPVRRTLQLQLAELNIITREELQGSTNFPV